MTCVRRAGEERLSMAGTIRFSTFPRTQSPPEFTGSIVSIFQAWEASIATIGREKGLTSDAVLRELRPDLVELGFIVEQGKSVADKIKQPVFFGENGIPALQYEVDAYHPEWRCGLEVEAGRAWLGNAIYRDLIQALVMVDLQSSPEHLHHIS